MATHHRRDNSNQPEWVGWEEVAFAVLPMEQKYYKGCFF
jgi:hypothetical protein